MIDALVIGGGFYGCTIATYLASRRGFRHVALIEQEGELMARASFNNQARIHNGYHYPRSYPTAYASRINLPKFVRHRRDAVRSDFTKVYAVTRDSKVTAGQFRRFCQDVDIQLEGASADVRRLFESRLIEDVFAVREFAFDASILRDMAAGELSEAGVDVRLSTRVTHVNRLSGVGVRVILDTEGRCSESLDSRYVFNCTYSGINHIGGDWGRSAVGLKHELAEIALVLPPADMAHIGVTVIDGAFFSFMPHPATGTHSLSHVRYTPHVSWVDTDLIAPYARLDDPPHTRVDRMLRDAMRYLPLVAESTYVKSLFEIKTVFVKSESDDGRPILFEKHASLPGTYSVLGAKIDNVYDVLEALEHETF